MPIDIRELLAHEAEASVSITLPLERTGREVKQNPIRLGNLAKQAREELEALGRTRAEIDAVLAPAQLLVDDPSAWDGRQDGLALYLSGDFKRQLMLPRTLPARMTCAPRFHLLPLLPLAQGDDRFHVLALSKNGVKLHAGTRFGLEELPRGKLPKDMQSALWMDDPEPVLQQHAGGPGAPGRRTGQHYHGQGGSKDLEDDQLLRFFRHVDEAVVERIAEEGTPLVLAADRGHVAIYREANTHPRLLDETVTGSPDRVDLDALHADAWPIAREPLHAARDRVVQTYRQRAGTGATACGAEAVYAAAKQGRIETALFVGDQPLWGRATGDGYHAEIHAERQPGDFDLIDQCACETLRHGGRALIVGSDELPPDTHVCALLRH